MLKVEANSLIQLMKTSRITLLVAAAAALLGLIPGAAMSKVPFVRECPGKDRGAWNWGEAPSACEASRFGGTSKIKFIYGDFVFDRTHASKDEHRKAYVTSIHALIRDLSIDYIKAQTPGVTEDEVRAFVEAIEAVAAQETYWSHYRVGEDGRYKLMTGDQMVSHGMMQINQKYHASKERDTSFDLVGNISFGIEHFYAKWEKARKAPCVQAAKKQTREQTLINITRSAYGAYNGGSDAICRWTQPTHPWFKNDKNYFGKLTGKPWSPWVLADDHKLDLNLDCIRAGDYLCAVAKNRKDEYLASRPLLMEDGSTCIMGEGNELQCARDLRVFTCLAAMTPDLETEKPIKVSGTDGEVKKLQRRFHEDRMALCAAADKGFALIGDAIIANQDLPIRAEIGGRVLGYAKKGLGFQVLDIDVGLNSTDKRHYRIRLNGKVEGWVDAGTEASSAKLVRVESKAFSGMGPNIRSWLPSIGSKVEISKADGIKILVAPEMGSARPEVKAHLPKGATPVVDSIQILGAANEVWLKIRAGEETGYIFAGRTYPTLTVQDWV